MMAWIVVTYDSLRRYFLNSAKGNESRGCKKWLVRRKEPQLNVMFQSKPCEINLSVRLKLIEKYPK